MMWLRDIEGTLKNQIKLKLINSARFIMDEQAPFERYFKIE